MDFHAIWRGVGDGVLVVIAVVLIATAVPFLLPAAVDSELWYCFSLLAFSFLPPVVIGYTVVDRLDSRPQRHALIAMAVFVALGYFLSWLLSQLNPTPWDTPIDQISWQELLLLLASSLACLLTARVHFRTRQRARSLQQSVLDVA